jgi:hypothetical protein
MWRSKLSMKSQTRSDFWRLENVLTILKEKCLWRSQLRILRM